jgi:hypothetical protein
MSITSKSSLVAIRMSRSPKRSTMTRSMTTATRSSRVEDSTGAASST